MLKQDLEHDLQPFDGEIELLVRLPDGSVRRLERSVYTRDAAGFGVIVMHASEDVVPLQVMKEVSL